MRDDLGMVPNFSRASRMSSASMLVPTRLVTDEPGPLDERLAAGEVRGAEKGVGIR